MENIMQKNLVQKTFIVKRVNMTIYHIVASCFKLPHNHKSSLSQSVLKIQLWLGGAKDAQSNFVMKKCSQKFLK